MTNDQFNLVVKLMRGRPQTAANLAARAVLVGGVPQARAMRQFGATRSSVCDAVHTYGKAHRQLQQLYAQCGDLSNDHFNLIVKLMRGRPQTAANLAARAVLVGGVPQARAMRQFGATRSSVCDAVHTYANAHWLLQQLYATAVAASS